MPECAVLQGYLVQEACESTLLLLSPADRPLVKPTGQLLMHSAKHCRLMLTDGVCAAYCKDNSTAVTACNGCIQHVLHLRTSACFHKPLVLSSYVPLVRAFCTI